MSQRNFCLAEYTTKIKPKPNQKTNPKPTNYNLQPTTYNLQPTTYNLQPHPQPNPKPKPRPKPKPKPKPKPGDFIRSWSPAVNCRLLCLSTPVTKPHIQESSICNIKYRSRQKQL